MGMLFSFPLSSEPVRYVDSDVFESTGELNKTIYVNRLITKVLSGDDESLTGVVW